MIYPENEDDEMPEWSELEDDANEVPEDKGGILRSLQALAVGGFSLVGIFIFLYVVIRLFKAFTGP